MRLSFKNGTVTINTVSSQMFFVTRNNCWTFSAQFCTQRVNKCTTTKCDNAQELFLQLICSTQLLYWLKNLVGRKSHAFSHWCTVRLLLVNFPFLNSNIPSSPAYCVFISQLTRYTGLAPGMNVLFRGPGDFPVSYLNRDTPLNNNTRKLRQSERAPLGACHYDVLPFDPKIYRRLPLFILHLCMKYEVCRSNTVWVITLQRSLDRQTDGLTKWLL